MAIIYSKDKKGNVITNDVPNIDVGYWKGKGWSDKPFGATQADLNPVSPPTGQNIPAPQNDTQKPLSQRVADTPANLTANDNFVNAVFKSVKNRDATAQELAQYRGKTVGEIRNQLIPASSKPTTLDANTQTAKLEVPTYNTMTGDPDAFMAGITKLYDTLNKPTTDLKGLEDTQTQYENKYINLLEKQLTRGQRQLDLEEKFQIEKKAENLNDIDTKINTKIAEYEAIKQRINAQPILSASINAQNAYQKRIAAADIAVLNAQRAGIMDKLTLAKDYVNRALELEFGGIQDQINATKQFLEINSSKLDKEQSKIAKKNTFVLDAISNLLSEQKAEKGKLYKLQLALIQNGKDPSLVDMTKSYEENLLANANNLQPAVKSGGGISRTFKFSSSNQSALLGVGFSLDDITAVEININNGYSIDDIINSTDMSDKQAEALRQQFNKSGYTSEDYLQGINSGKYSKYVKTQLTINGEKKYDNNGKPIMIDTKVIDWSQIPLENIAEVKQKWSEQYKNKSQASAQKSNKLPYSLISEWKKWFTK